MDLVPSYIGLIEIILRVTLNGFNVLDVLDLSLTLFIFVYITNNFSLNSTIEWIKIKHSNVFIVHKFRCLYSCMYIDIFIYRLYIELYKFVNKLLNIYIILTTDKTLIIIYIRIII